MNVSPQTPETVGDGEGAEQFCHKPTAEDQLHEAPLAAVARALPPSRSGKKRVGTTLRTWALQGLPAGDQDPIRLKTWMVGGIRHTTLARVREFWHELAKRRERRRRQAAVELETPARQRKRQEAAKKKLEELGLR